MNLPNKLTVLRVVMIPVFVALYFGLGIPHNYFWALLVFGAAAITDLFDGIIARRRGLLTDFGALMDPLADKLLVMAAMLCFLATGLVHTAVVIMLLSREFLVTSLRLVAAGKKIVIRADNWGKAKTAFQMVWICFGLLFLWLDTWLPVYHHLPYWVLFNALTLVVLALTTLSGLNYLVKNKKLIADA